MRRMGSSVVVVPPTMPWLRSQNRLRVWNGSSWSRVVELADRLPLAGGELGGDLDVGQHREGEGAHRVVRPDREAPGGRAVVHRDRIPALLEGPDLGPEPHPVLQVGEE